MKYIEKLDLQSEEIEEVENLEKHTVINNNPFSVDEYEGHDRDFLSIDGDYNDGFNQLNETVTFGINCNVSREVNNLKISLDNITLLYNAEIEQLLNNLKNNTNIKLINDSYSLDNDVLIENKENIVIDGNFSTITLKDTSIIFKIVNCKNLTIKNLNIVSNTSKGGRDDGTFWYWCIFAWIT